MAKQRPGSAKPLRGAPGGGSRSTSRRRVGAAHCGASHRGAQRVLRSLRRMRRKGNPRTAKPRSGSAASGRGGPGVCAQRGTPGQQSPGAALPRVGAGARGCARRAEPPDSIRYSTDSIGGPKPNHPWCEPGSPCRGRRSGGCGAWGGSRTPCRSAPGGPPDRSGRTR